MDTSKFVIVLTSLVVMALLVGAVFLPTVSSSTTRTITTIEENDEPGWLKFGYSATDNYNFNVEIDGDNLNVGGQTGELYDMMVLSTDALSIVVDEDTLVAITPNGAVDLGTTASVVKTSGGLDVNGTTYSAPLWSYYPKVTGNYAYFDHADLLTDDKPLSTWGNFAGVYAYNSLDYLDIGLTMDATITDGVIEGVTWVGSDAEEIDEEPEEPFNPGSLNPLDPSVIDDPFEPSAGTMGADPTTGTQVGNLYYNLISNNGQYLATVIGYSSSTNWNEFNQIPSTVNYSDIDYTVYRIGTRAFSGCSDLLNITLPNTITTIQAYAFENCTSLISALIPSSVTSISTGTFSGCTNLTTLSLPDTLTQLPSSFARYCASLDLDALPTGLTHLDSNVFEGCTSLTLDSLPDSLLTIYGACFKGCSSLTLDSLPDGLTTVGSNAFNGCTNITIDKIPDGCNVGGWAFVGCSGITSMTLGNNCQLSDSPFASTTFEGLVIAGSLGFEDYAFSSSNIKEVLNLGSVVITTTTAGLNADEVRTDVEALGYVAPLSIALVERVPIESPTTDVINILPLVAGVGLLLIALGVLIYRRT